MILRGRFTADKVLRTVKVAPGSMNSMYANGDNGTPTQASTAEVAVPIDNFCPPYSEARSHWTVSLSNVGANNEA